MSELTPTGNGAALGARTSRRSRITAAIRRIASEPFVHFVILGVAIFVLSGLARDWRDTRRYSIALDSAALRALVSRWERQYGGPPTPQQLGSAARNQVREEILYREGLALGLDREDEIVRRRVAQKVEFLLNDLAIVKEPTEAELRGWYDGHPEAYSEPARVSFTHVYFSPDRDGDEGASHRAVEELARLRTSGEARAPDRGDRFPYPYDHASVSGPEVVRLFGDSPLAEAALDAPLNRWWGPIRSGYGWHLLYVSGRSDPRVRPFADVKEKVAADLVAAARERANAQAFGKLQAKYAITVADPGILDAIARR